ncbi:hypothetical protein Tco_1122664 [Tanacetum coccineum]|uniref:Monodehydroascorbate reductase n=1 Tax=Tanacetum coccineum TaxID=301880 RepID=A0ABQ5J174_9ASTR
MVVLFVNTLMQNTMAEQNVPAQAPTRTDEQILPRSAWLQIGKSNLLFDAQKIQKNPIFQISVDILRNTNFFRAFSASASVPAIYIQQFWNTMKYDEKTGVYCCQVDEQWFNLSADLLRKALDITPVDPAHPFELPPTGDTVIDFVNQLGYPEPVEFVSNIRVNYVYQPWRAILSLINQCLTGKTSGSDKPRHPVLQMLWGIVTKTNIDHAELLWEEFTQGIQTFFSHKASHKASLKDPKKKAVPLLIPYGRFTKMIIYYLGSTSNVHRRPESPRHLPGDDFLLGNLKFIPKGETDEVFGMAIPKPLITEAIQQSSYYPKYLEMVAKNTKKTPQDSASKQSVHGTKHAPPKKLTPVKPTKPAPVKQTKPPSSKLPKSPKNKPSKITPSRKVRKGKPSLVDEEDEAQQEPEPQREGDDPALELAKKLSLDAHQEKGEGEGADADLERAIKLSLDPSFPPQRQAPVGGVAIRDRVAEEIQRLPNVEGKGKAIITEEQAAHSVIDLSKKKSTTDQFILQRRDQAPHDSTTEPSFQPQDDASKKVVHESSSTTDLERTESEIEATAPKVDKEQGKVASTTVTSGVGISVHTENQAGSDPGQGHEALAGSNLEPMQEDSGPGEEHVALAGPNPEHMDEDLYATAYPKVHENPKLRTDEHVILENPESSSATLSSMKNLDETNNFGDQFLNDKPTEDDQEKTNVVDETDSIIPDPSHQTNTSAPPVINISSPKPSSQVNAPPTIITTLPEITPFIALQLRVVKLEQDMSKVKKTYHSTAVLASIQSQVPTVVENLVEKYSVLPAPESSKKQESEKSPKEIIKIKREQGKKKPEPMYTIKSTDKAALEEFDLKGVLFNIMHKNKSANRNPANYRLYHALMEALLEDENAMDQEVADKVKDHKRKRDSVDDEDDDDEGPSTGSNQAHTSSAWQITDTRDTSPGPSKQRSDHQSKQSSDDNPITDEGHVSDPEDTDNAHILKVSAATWFKPIPEEERPATPEPEWTIPSNDYPEPENNWANVYTTMYQDPKENKLQRKTGDIGSFIKWFCKRTGKNKLFKADLEGPTFNLVEAFHNNSVALQFQMDECHKLLTDNVDLVNPEGHQILRNVYEPLPLGGPQSQLKAARYLNFGLEELVQYLWVESERDYNISAAYGITHWWFSRKEFYINKHREPSDRDIFYKEYKISEKDFKNLHPNDFEDLFLLHLQDKLNHLPKSDKVNLHTAVNIWIRNIVIRKGVEDLQLGVESYQTKLNLEQPNWDASDFLFKEDYTIVNKPIVVIYRDRDDNKKMMRIDEVHKFSDGTLMRIRDKLDFTVKDLRLFKFNKGMETRKWTEDDKRRSKEFIEDTLPILLSFTHCGNKTILRVLRIILVILPEHPSETKVFHNEDGNPARANIKQALGSYERSHKGVKASANSDIMYFFTSAQDGDPLQDDVRLCLGDDLKKAHDHNQRQVKDESKDYYPKSATWKLQSRLRGEDNLQGFFRPIDHAVGGNVQQKRNMVASAFGEDEGVRSVPRPIRLFYLIASVRNVFRNVNENESDVYITRLIKRKKGVTRDFYFKPRAPCKVECPLVVASNILHADMRTVRMIRMLLWWKWEEKNKRDWPIATLGGQFLLTLICVVADVQEMFQSTGMFEAEERVEDVNKIINKSCRLLLPILANDAVELHTMAYSLCLVPINSSYMAYTISDGCAHIRESISMAIEVVMKVESVIGLALTVESVIAIYRYVVFDVAAND